MATSGTNHLSYDYQDELAECARIGMAVAAEMRAAEEERVRSGAAVQDAAKRLMRQAAREPICPSAYARAKRRYIVACDAYAAALSARRIAA